MLKSIIVNVQGNLSAELGSELYLKLKTILTEPHLLLLDASGLDSWDEIGIQFLHKLVSKAEEADSKLAVCHLPQKFWREWEREFKSSIPRFPQRKDGILYLESFLEGSVPQKSETSSGSHQDLESKKIKKATDSEEEWIYCPHCETILTVHQFGDNQCGKCGGKFYIQSNFHVSIYERLV